MSLNNYSKKNNICAVIPFYNESKNIEEIIKNTLNYVDFVIAVNDGSTDDSCSKIPHDKNIFLITYPDNRGKGFALNQGFKESISRQFEITITLDADFQHSPKLIPDLINALNSFDIVIGNRLTDFQKMPMHRIASNKLTSFFLSLKTRQKLLDTQCGFRAYKTKILESILPSNNGFDAESQILVNAARHNYKIGFVKIPTIYGNEKSKMKSLQTIAGFIKVMLS